MNVICAEAMGLCFGVRDALNTVREIDVPSAVTIHGELVHNETVLVELQTRGFQMTPEAQRDLPVSTDEILITAHGISDRERLRLEYAGKRLIDTTCPLVRRVHESAQMLAAEGYHVVLIGRRGHVEVQGIAEDLADCTVIGSTGDVTTWPYSRLGIICQTTTPPRLVDEITQVIRDQNPSAEVRLVNTVCQPTRDRQSAVEQLCPQVDGVVVVGGANSNNTRQLVELCRQRGKPAWHVRNEADLDPDWFVGCETIGLTAGTSTLDETIRAVYERLCELSVPADHVAEV